MQDLNWAEALQHSQVFPVRNWSRMQKKKKKRRLETDSDRLHVTLAGYL